MTGIVVRKRGQNLTNIQFLRFVAAALVVFSHTGLAIYGIGQYYTNLGGVGVDIFFVISGFIMPFMTYGAAPSPLITAKFGSLRFLLKRLTRIWPLYAMATLTMVAIAGLLTTQLFPVNQEVAYHFGPHKIDFVWIVSSLTFTHASSSGPIIPLGWTLQAEFVFYVFFAIVLLFKPTRTIFYPLIYALVFGVFVTIAPIFQVTESFVGKFFAIVGYPIMLEFLFGMILYEAYQRGFRSSVPVSILFYLVGIGIFCLSAFTATFNFIPYNLDRPLTWGVAATFVVWAALSTEGKISFGKLSVLGDSSYSLYLVHGLMTPIMVGVWVGIGGQNYLPWYIYAAGTLVICQFTALIIYRFIEEPIHEATKRKIDIGWTANRDRIRAFWTR